MQPTFTLGKGLLLLSIEMALKKYKIQICILDYTMISLTIDGL
jgi:hypothetical protein